MYNIQRKRNSNLELYRIIVMLLIVAHHYVVNSGLLDELARSPLAAKSLFFYLFGMWGKTGINCFVLITGYFMCRSSITLRKFLKLLLEVLFYNVVIYAAFVMAGYEDFSVTHLCGRVFPFKMVQTNFTGCFLWFYLCIPFLTVLVGNIDRRMHQLLIMLSLGIYCGAGLPLPGFHLTMNYVSWFCVLFFIASYIRIYGFMPNVSTRRWGGYLVGSMLVSMLSVVGVVYVDSECGRYIWPYSLVSDSNAVLAVVTSVVAFMYFKDLRMRQSKWINTVAASTFGVLMIHANSDTMRQWLWRDVVGCARNYYEPYACLYAVGSVLIIFAVCVLIDYVRIHTVERYVMGYVDRVVSAAKSR